MAEQKRILIFVRQTTKNRTAMKNFIEPMKSIMSESYTQQQLDNDGNINFDVEGMREEFEMLMEVMKEHINLDYENRMSKMTKYEKIVFNQCIEQSPELFDTKIKMIELMKKIKSQKITKKSLAEQN